METKDGIKTFYAKDRKAWRRWWIDSKGNKRDDESYTSFFRNANPKATGAGAIKNGWSA